MARPREFDEAAALDAAIQCFWAQGYEAASVRGLAQRMGITGASLYNTFGDKRTLYRRALDHYVERSVADRIRRCDAMACPREAIGVFFEEVIARSLGDPECKGCMLVNSALEPAPADPGCRQAVAEVFTQLETFFRRSVAAGQRSGAIAIAQPPEDLARLLLGCLLGIRVLARTRPERELLEGIVRPAFALLDSHKAHLDDRRVRQDG